MPESEIRQITLPSGERVPELGQGTWGWAEGERSREEEISALRTGLDLGLTLVDTAEMYANGAAEELVGETEDRVISPTVLSGVTMEIRAAKEELFGPVAPIISVRGEEEALRAANDTDLGLSSAVFTSDTERGARFARFARFARRIEASMTHVNDHPVNDEPNTAFGGEKLSGLGRFGGRWALEEFTTEHWVSVQHEPRTYPL